MTLTPEALAFATAYDLAQNSLNPTKLIEVPAPPVPFQQPAADPILPGRGIPSYTAASAQKAGETLLASGVPLAEVQAALAADGYHFAVETRSPLEIEHQALAEHLAPVAPKPESYSFDMHSNGRADNLAAKNYDAEAFTESAKEWSAKLQLPPAVADDLVGRAVDFAFQTERLSPSELEARDIEAQGKLNYFATRRGITVDKMLENARMVLAAGGKFSGRLDASGVLGCWPIVVELSDHAQNMKTAFDLRKR